MPEVKIKTEEQLFTLLESALVDASFLESTKITIAPELRTLKIHFSGDYDATITPSMMRSLLAIQDSVYDIYSLQKYGVEKRLSNDERESVDLVAAVKPGTTSVEVFLEKALEVFSTMTGEQALIGISILCGTFLIASLGKRYFDYHEKIKETQQRVTETQGLTNIVATAMTTCLEGQREFIKTIAKEPFTALQINGETLSHDELHAMAKTPREKREEQDNVISGNFKITKIYIEEAGTFIDAIHDASGRIIPYINILADFISAGDYQWLKDAVDQGTGKPVYMRIITHERSGKIINAYLQSFEKESATPAAKKSSSHSDKGNSKHKKKS
jgi:hypothetical protein